MKHLFALLFSVFISFTIFSQDKIDEQKRDAAFYNATNKWFSAWKLVSNDIYQIGSVKPVEFVFFDNKYVYSTSSITVKDGNQVRGSSLMNLSFVWRKSLHNDTITLPDKSVVPVRLMSFAAEIPGEKDKSFFVMPLPAYWKESGTTSKELGLDNLITGVFIHEFSHSQQMQNFGKRITEYEQQSKFDVEFSDDIVQNIFDKDSSYVRLYSQEVIHFYGATASKPIDHALVKKGIQIMKQRQTDYFTGKYENLKLIDDFFLTMEGLGQYSMYLWLINPKGGNIHEKVAIEGVRRKRKWWSQDEGFALFLILDQLSKPASWAKEMFGDKTSSVITLIGEQLK